MKDFAEFLKMPFYRIWVDLPLGVAISLLIISGSLEPSDYHIILTRAKEASWLVQVSALAIILFLGEIVATIGDISVGLLFDCVLNEEGKVENVTPQKRRIVLFALLPVVGFICQLVYGWPFCIWWTPVLSWSILLFVLLLLYFIFTQKVRIAAPRILRFKSMVSAMGSNSAVHISEVHFVLSRLFSGAYLIIIAVAPVIVVSIPYTTADRFAIVLLFAIISVWCLIGAVHYRFFANSLVYEIARRPQDKRNKTK